jgi:hypothetical protein
LTNRNQGRGNSRERLVPTEADWGDYKSDLDQKWAHDQFFGRSNEEMQPYIHGSPLGAAEDLRSIPEVPFRYYAIAFRDYVMSGQFRDFDAADAASCFIRLVLQKLEQQPRYIIPIMPEILPAVEYVAHNQATFHAKESIYGSFPEMLNRIHALYDEAKGRYRRL